MGDVEGKAPLHSPSMEALLGRMVMAPTATSSRLRTGEVFAPQLSEPTHRKWPVRLAWRAASRTLLVVTGLGLSKDLGPSSNLPLVPSHSTLSIYPILYHSPDPCLSGKSEDGVFRTLALASQAVKSPARL